MFAKIFLKEWKDNLVLFLISILFMLAMVALSLSGQKGMTIYFMGAFLLLFLPIAGILIGSGGFYSEFKDNAWIYLFSRPIKKETIWLIKYVSLFSILAVVVLGFLLARQFLPGLNDIAREFKAPDELKGLVSFTMFLAFPFLIFTISYSLSILYEKQFTIVLLSAFLGAGLGFVLQHYHLFLRETYLYDGQLKGFQVFLALSFACASVLTLKKADFSQTGKKVLCFSKYLALFLALAFGLATVWVAKGNPFSGRKWVDFYNSVEYGNDVYLPTYERRFKILRYHSQNDDLEKIGEASKIAEHSFSVASDKIAYYENIEGENVPLSNLCVMTMDGSERKVLARADDPGSRYYRLTLWGNCLLSPDGTKVAFQTLGKDSSTIWWMNTEGDSPISQLPSPSRFVDLIAWAGTQDVLLVGVKERMSNYKIVSLDLETGNSRTLIENVRNPFQIRVSLGYNFLALFRRVDGPGNRTELIILDLRTQEKKTVAAGELKASGDIEWGKSGDQFAVLRKNMVLIYSLKEDRIMKSIPCSLKYGTLFGWLAGDEKFCLLDANVLRIFDSGFNEEKKIKVPGAIENPLRIWGLKNRVLVFDEELSRLWRLDLDKEEWKKIY